LYVITVEDAPSPTICLKLHVFVANAIGVGETPGEVQPESRKIIHPGTWR
jgi:hypothetical protein